MPSFNFGFVVILANGSLYKNGQVFWTSGSAYRDVAARRLTEYLPIKKINRVKRGA